LILACPSRYNPAGFCFGIHSLAPLSSPKPSRRTDPKTTRAREQAADFNSLFLYLVFKEPTLENPRLSPLPRPARFQGEAKCRAGRLGCQPFFAVPLASSFAGRSNRSSVAAIPEGNPPLRRG